MEKSVVLALALLCLCVAGVSQEKEAPREFEMTEGDTTYTMKQYVFCLYLSGDNRSQSEEEAQALQAQHMNHMNSMAEEKGLIVAGPFGDESEKRGILVFDVATTEEAEEAISSDPAVKAGRLTYECHP